MSTKSIRGQGLRRGNKHVGNALMTDEFDKELFDLLMKHYGEDWKHTWEGIDDGFIMNLVVWGADGDTDG